MLLNPYRFGGVALLPPQWDPATVSAPLSLSVSNTRVTLPINNANIAKTVRGTKALTTGKWYWEVYIMNAVIGSGTTTGNGLVDSTFAYATSNLAGNTTANSGGLWLSGRLYFNAAFTTPGPTFALTDTMMFALDIAAGSLWVGKNGTWVGNPVAGTGAAKTGLSTSATYYPAANPWSSDASNAVVLDLKGATNSAYPAPSGFTPYTQ